MRFLKAGDFTKTSTISNSANNQIPLTVLFCALDKARARQIHLLRCDLRFFVRRITAYTSAVARMRLVSKLF